MFTNINIIRKCFLAIFFISQIFCSSLTVMFFRCFYNVRVFKWKHRAIRVVFNTVKKKVTIPWRGDTEEEIQFARLQGYEHCRVIQGSSVLEYNPEVNYFTRTYVSNRCTLVSPFSYTKMLKQLMKWMCSGKKNYKNFTIAILHLNGRWCWRKDLF